MAYNTYTITLSNGNVLTYVSPTTTDYTSSALTLIGQADLGYGVPLNENFVHLLENFADSVAPYYVDGSGNHVTIAPLVGQLWYNTSTGYLNLYDNTSTWEPMATQAWVEANFTGNTSSGLYATESWVEVYVSAQNFVTQTYLTAQGYLTANQTITLSGDVSGSGSTSIITTLSPNGVTAGTYDKVIIDATGRVTTGDLLNAQDIINALGYTPAAVGTGPGQTLYVYGALGTTAGTTLNYLGFQSTDSNTNTLQLLQNRFANGTDWTTASTRMQNITDATSQGYIEFNPQNHKAGTGIGAGNVMQLVAQNSGAATGVLVNQKLYVVGSSAADPLLYFQTGTINNNNSGFSAQSTLGLISYSQTFGILYFSANSDGSNNVAILPNGSVNTIGVNGGSAGVSIKSGASNQNILYYDPSGNLFSKPNGAQVFVVDSVGNLTTNGTITNNNGNWFSNTNSNTSFWVNTSSGTNLGVLWFDYANGTPYSWRMTAQTGGGGAANQFSYDANGVCTVGTLYVNKNGGQATGIENTTQTNFGILNNGQRRIRIDGFYDFEVGGGTDEVIPGDINIFFGQGNYGDGNRTNNGDRRRLSMQSDGNMVIYSLNDGVLWSADTAGSDERLKTNIKEYTGGLEFIKQIPVRTFQWKKDNKTFNDGGKTHVGFVAQELEEIGGHDAVSKHGKNDWRVVHKQALVPHLVAAVQELTTENDYLKDRIRKLENKMSMFEEVMRQMKK